MELTTATALVTTAIGVLDYIGLNPIKLTGREIGKQSTDYVKKLIANPSYKAQLTKIIQRLLDECHQEYGVSPLDTQFRFFQFPAFWEIVLTYQLFGEDPQLSPDDFAGSVQLIRPTQRELDDFVGRLMTAIKEDKELKKRFVEENYKEAALRFALTGTQQLAELIARPDAVSSGIVNAVLDSVEREELANYRPYSALRQLQRLQSVVSRQLAADLPLQARLNYLLGKTHQEIAETDQADKFFIQAYALHPITILYAEQAARAYFSQNLMAEAAATASAIKVMHPLNPIAAAVLLSLDNPTDFEARLAEVPQLIAQDEQFKTTTLHLMAGKATAGSDLAEVLLRKDLSPYRPSKQLTPENRRFQIVLALFVIERALKQISPIITIDEPHVPLRDEAVSAAYEVIKQFTDLLQPTEKAAFLTHHYYVRGLTRWLLNGDIEDYAELRRRFSALSAEERQRYGHQLVFALYQAAEYEEALKIINQIDTSKLPELGFMRYTVLRKLQRPRAEVRVALGQHIKELQRIDDVTFYRALIYLEHCETNAEQLAIVEEILQREQVKPGLAATLLQAHARVAAPEHREEAIELLQKAADLLQPTTDAVYRQEVANLYHALKEYELAGVVLEGWPGFPHALDKGAEWLRLSIQYHRRSDSAELREGLRAWRQQHGIHSEFCIWEIQLAEMLRDWERMLEVVAAAKGHISDVSGLRWAKLVALNKLQRKPELETELREIVSEPTSVERRHVFKVAELAARIGHLDWGLELVYPLASNKDDKVARGHFFHLMLGQRQEESLMEYAQAQVGTALKYSVDGIVQPRLALTAAIVDGGLNPLADELLGKTKGHKYPMTHPATGRPITVEILEITDVYDGLMREIFEDGGQKDATLPFEAMDIEGPEIEHIHAALSKLAGAEGAARQIRTQQLLAEYETGESTFSTLTAALFDGDGLNTWHTLTAQSQTGVPGVMVPPRSVFDAVSISSDQQYILDWTSLSLLYQLSQEFEVTPPQRLGISLYIVEFLEDRLQKQQSAKPVETTAEVIGTSVRAHVYPVSMHDRQIAYIQSLLVWIKAHCETRVVVEKLDVLRQATLSEGHHQEHMQYIIDTAFLAAPINTLLVSDDTTFLQFSLRSGNTISSEAFLAAYFPDQFQKQLLPKMLDLHYVGLTIDKDTLLREFKQAGGALLVEHCNASKAFPDKWFRTRTRCKKLHCFCVKSICSLL
ncbi:PIN domain-containing protein [Hymenobacter cellulosilyticus]|uniref:PIN domain-containing protein n=1 Tax=Hymenobacter cellulosilyticus TaxID=2932248 RepID=A0A8T9QD56_9BACT|nr:hypothetical protein [Hymenobacter cellulosilyticus]UOQ75165.1 hypothetical protein MUN79_28670 [Hymenobacter cellulosilyticus]